MSCDRARNKVETSEASEAERGQDQRCPQTIEGLQRLRSPEKILSLNETQILDAADRSYAGKCFEYFDLEDAPLGYSRYPDLNALDSIAKKLIGI
jgi:hypothetical protein